MADGANRRVWVLLAALAVGAAACERLSAKKIGKVVGELDAWDGRTVTVMGTVQERIDVPSIKCYILTDGSGSIGVVTRGRLPQVGQKLLAKGRVQRSFSIGSRKLTVIIENPEARPPSRSNPAAGRRGPG